MVYFSPPFVLIQERSRSLQTDIFSSSVVGLREPISTTRHSARAGMHLAKSRSCAGVAEFGLDLESTDMFGIFQSTICAHSGEVSVSGRGHIFLLSGRSQGADINYKA